MQLGCSPSNEDEAGSMLPLQKSINKKKSQKSGTSKLSPQTQNTNYLLGIPSILGIELFPALQHLKQMEAGMKTIKYSIQS